MIHLHKVPRLFQLWACKQIINITGKNLIQSLYKPHHDHTCLSCDQCVETCAHVISWNDSGRFDALFQSINILDKWLKKVGMHIQLRKYILQYDKVRGGIGIDKCTTCYWQAIQQVGCITWLDWLEMIHGRDDIQGDADNTSWVFLSTGSLWHSYNTNILG